MTLPFAAERAREERQFKIRRGLSCVAALFVFAGLVVGAVKLVRWAWGS